MILDLVGNCELHGFDLDNLNVMVPEGCESNNKQEFVDEKLCPQCESLIHYQYSECPECGYVFSKESLELEESKRNPELQDVYFGKEPPKWKEVYNAYYREHESRKSGKRLMRVDYECAGGSMFGISKNPTDWVCFPCHYSGFAVEKKAIPWWKRRTDEPFPESLEEALFIADTLKKPSRILVDESGQHPEIIDYEFEIVNKIDPTDDVPF